MVTDDYYVLPTLIAAWSIQKNAKSSINLAIIHTGQKDIDSTFARLRADNFQIRIIRIKPELNA